MVDNGRVVYLMQNEYQAWYRYEMDRMMARSTYWFSTGGIQAARDERPREPDANRLPFRMWEGGRDAIRNSGEPLFEEDARA